MAYYEFTSLLLLLPIIAFLLWLGYKHKQAPIILVAGLMCLAVGVHVLSGQAIFAVVATTSNYSFVNITSFSNTTACIASLIVSGTGLCSNGSTPSNQQSFTNVPLAQLSSTNQTAVGLTGSNPVDLQIAGITGFSLLGLGLFFLLMAVLELLNIAEFGLRTREED